MSGYWFRLRDRVALAAGPVVPFLVALVLVPFRADRAGSSWAC